MFKLHEVESKNILYYLRNNILTLFFFKNTFYSLLRVMVYQNFKLIHFKITIFFPKQFDTVEISGNTSDELLKACGTKRGYGKPIVAKFNYDTLLFTNVTIMPIQSFNSIQISHSMPIQSFNSIQTTHSMPIQSFNSIQISHSMPIQSFNSIQISHSMPIQSFNSIQISHSMPIQSFNSIQISHSMPIQYKYHIQCQFNHSVQYKYHIQRQFNTNTTFNANSIQIKYHIQC